MNLFFSVHWEPPSTSLGRKCNSILPVTDHFTRLMEMSPWLCVLTAQKVNQTSPLTANSARSADSLSLKVQNFPPGSLPWRSFGRRDLPPGVGPKSAPGGGRTFWGSSVFASSVASRVLPILTQKGKQDEKQDSMENIKLSPKGQAWESLYSFVFPFWLRSTRDWGLSPACELHYRR